MPFVKGVEIIIIDDLDQPDDPNTRQKVLEWYMSKSDLREKLIELLRELKTAPVAGALRNGDDDDIDDDDVVIPHATLTDIDTLLWRLEKGDHV